jgi:protein-L-isoaspartate(D-aspartate) O-methyltransferase
MNFETARNQMLSQQIRTWDVLDEAVLAALRETPRELFVSKSDRELAFADVELPLAHGQRMLSPKLEGKLLQELRIQPTDHALVVGTGSGYLTACMARLAREVHGIEYFEDLSAAAQSHLRNLPVDNVFLETADATQMAADRKFDVIAVTASVPVLGEKFIRLLRPRGRLFIVVGRGHAMEAQVITLSSDRQWTTESLFETELTPMVNAGETETFVL